MAPHSSTLAWKIPWMEEPGRLQSMGSLSDREDMGNVAGCGAEAWRVASAGREEMMGVAKPEQKLWLPPHFTFRS